MGTVWALALGGSIALSVLAAQHDRLPGDLRLTEWLQDSPFPGESLSEAVRAVTSTQVVLVTGFVAAAALGLLGRWRQALALAVVLAVLPLAQHEIKEIVDRARPSPELVEVRAGFSSPSFPAGHVMSPMVLYGFLLCSSIWPPGRLVITKGRQAHHRRVGSARPELVEGRAQGHLPGLVRATLGTWSAAVLVLSAPANVYMGVHWPSDVLGGYAWGVVLLLPAVFAAGASPGQRTRRG
mgnify:CR=1 FL=1